MPVERDNQKRRLYNAEHALRNLGLGHRFESWEQVKQYVHQVVHSQSWKRCFGSPSSVKMTKKGWLYARGGALRYSREYRLHLPKGWAWDKIVILHELAHCAVSSIDHAAAWHGYEFVEVFCYLIKQELGEKVEQVFRDLLQNARVNRKEQALQLREAGLTFKHIARELGYKTPQAARSAVMSAQAATRKKDYSRRLVGTRSAVKAINQREE